MYRKEVTKISGPCSLPNGSSRSEWAAQWELVCDIHRNCYPDFHEVFNKSGDIIFHSWITEREWLAKRKKLRTGKTR